MSHNLNYGFDSFDSAPNAVNFRRTGTWQRFERNKLGACPICQNVGKGCDLSSAGIIHCRKSDASDRVDGYRSIGQSRTSIGCVMWVPDTEKRLTPEERLEQKLYRDKIAARDKSVRLARQANQSTANVIDREYQAKYDRLSVDEWGLNQFTKRGLSRADIERTTAYTQNNWLYVPIRDIDGLRIGAQYKKPDGGYQWDRPSRNHTKKHDELPLAFWGNRSNPERLIFVEGTGFKPYITNLKYDRDLVIGAAGGQFASSPLQIIESLTKYPTAKLVLMPDGASMFNSSVAGQYSKLFELLGDRPIEIGWWRQYNKVDGDIDEIGESTEIEYISSQKWARIALDCLHSIELGSIDRRGAQIRNERYLLPIDLPNPGTIQLISSGVGTGKTQQLESLFERWILAHPYGRIILLGYRNGLTDQTCKRLNVTNWRVGNGMEAAALEHEQRIAIVVDSCLQLDLNHIPAGTLIVVDEVEAVLKHMALGGTTGARTAEIQEHVTNIIDRALVSGGAVIGLEDSITNVSANGLRDLVANKYQSQLVINDCERFDWEVSIGGGNAADFTTLLMARLAAGERIVVPTTSQKYGEIIERIVVNRLPELVGKIERVDSKTINEKKELIADPGGYLRGTDIRLLILSPTVESGFSIDDLGDNPLFDRVMMMAVNLDTRTHKQMLARYRSNCPREIFAKDRGCESSGENGRNSHQSLKNYRTIANTTALEQGYGRIENGAIGEVWNRLDAQFRARASLSSAYLREYLRKELIDSGHNVSSVNWADIAAQYIKDNGIIIDWDVAGDISEIREELLDEEATELVEADGTKLTTEGARLTLSSSASTHKQKVVARKTLLHDRLPGISLSFDLIRDCVVEGRGRYLYQMELAYMMDKPELAWALDRELLVLQLNNPHVLYSQIPKYSQRVKLLFPICDAIKDLASGREYLEGDTAIDTIAKYARKESYQFWLLFGLNTRNDESDRAIANKILKKMGWQSRRIRQLGTGKDRISVYAIVNHSCPHRAEVYKALKLKHERTIANAKAANMPAHKHFNSNNPILKSLCVNPAQLVDPMPSANSNVVELVNGRELKVGDRVMYAGEWIIIDRLEPNVIGGFNSDGAYIAGSPKLLDDCA